VTDHHAVNTNWYRAAALFGVLVVTTLVVLPVFDNGFVYDDVDVIANGAVIHDPANLPKVFTRHAMFVSAEDRGSRGLDTYRPMTLVSFFWDSAISGRDPLAYHVTNLVMHLLCVSLVFLLLQILLGGNWGFALLGAAWFALSPHPNTAQIWINGRSDLFCTAYGVAAILVWRQALDAKPAAGRTLRHTVAGLLFLAGLLSKETLLMVLPTLWLWPERVGSFDLVARARRMAPLAAAGVFYLTLRTVVLGGMHASDGGAHVLTALKFLAPLELEGIVGALGPRRLYLRFLSDEFGGLSPAALAALGVVFLALLVGLFGIRRRAPVIAWGAFWFLVTLAPACMIASMLWPGFGRYLYLPSVGLAATLASGAHLLWSNFPRLRVAQGVVSGAYLVFLAMSLYSWAGDFKDVETLYGATIARNPDGPHAYGWLGISYRKAGREEDSIGPLAKARELAPGEPRYTQHLLYALIATKRDEPALALAEQCVALHPREAEECHLYLFADAQLTRPADAMNHLLECLKNDEDGSRCYEAFTHAVNAHQLRPVYRELADARLQEDDMAPVRARTEQAMRTN
jgi:tetratricopeptide (TPR) repeat protein